MISQVLSCTVFFSSSVMDSIAVYCGCRSFPIQLQMKSCNPGCSITSRASLHIEMVTNNCLHSARGSHGTIHFFFNRHPPCLVPCVLMYLRDVVDHSILRIVDPLQSAVSVDGFVCIGSDCIALVSRNKWHDSILKILSCCSTSDIRMDMEDSNCSIWKSGSKNVSTIVVRIRSRGCFRQCS